MLTDQDIDKLTSLLATKQDLVEVKTDIAHLKELVQGLIVSCDSMAKAIHELKLEYTGIVHQINRHEAWIKQIAEKIGITLATD